MKKMLAFLLVICISVGGFVSCDEEKTALKSTPTATEAPGLPEESELSEATETPKVTETSKATETPEVTETSQATETPKVTETPEATNVPSNVAYNTEKFSNPISDGSVADPFITYDNVTGYYYGLYTLGNRVELYRHKHVAKLFSDGETKVVYRATGENDVWGDIWAPEMHRGTDGKWYIYTSSRIEKVDTGKQLFVLGSLTSDPFGEWEFKGRPTNSLVYGIDPTVYTAPDGTKYMCFSKSTAKDGQVLEIAIMKDDYTCGSRKTIAKAELDWELVAPYVGTYAVLEGAFFVENNGRLFLIYSANGCWSDHYALGVLEYIGGPDDSLLLRNNWKKSSEPLMVYGNGVYGPGHASFFYSPDGTELWCVYHGMSQSNPSVQGAPRYCHLQKVEFDETGYPVLGKPIGTKVQISPPSGEIK